MIKDMQTLRTARQRERRRLGRFFGAAAIFLVLFLIFSAVYIGVRSGGFSFGRGAAETGTDLTSEAPAPDASGLRNLLLLCATPDKTDLRLLTVVQINYDDHTYSICSFSPREAVKTEERFGSFLEHYQHGGVKELTRAVEKISGIRIDRFIASDDNTFKRAINSMGALTFNFPHQINYRGADFAIVLIQGEQKMRGDDLLKYLRYCGALGDEGLEMQSKAVGECFRQYFTQKNMDKKDNLYQTLINTLQSDISVLDFKRSGALLQSMQQYDYEVNCIQYFRVIAD